MKIHTHTNLKKLIVFSSVFAYLTTSLQQQQEKVHMNTETRGFKLGKTFYFIFFRSFGCFGNKIRKIVLDEAKQLGLIENIMRKEIVWIYRALCGVVNIVRVESNIWFRVFQALSKKVHLDFDYNNNNW